MNRHRLGQSDEVKALGTGSDSDAVHAADTAAPKRRLRWRLVLAGVALIALGYALAETALAFGWWGPVVGNTNQSSSRTLTVVTGECDAAMDTAFSIYDYTNELTAGITTALDELDLEEAERLGARRAGAAEAERATRSDVEAYCGDDPDGLRGLRIVYTLQDDVYHDWSEACESLRESLGWNC